MNFASLVTIFLLCWIAAIFAEPGGQWGGAGGNAGASAFGQKPWQNGNGGQRQNAWQSGGGGGGGFGQRSASGAGQSYSSNSYDTPEKYGYDYTIPGANVHFAAFRQGGGGGSGGARSNGPNSFGRSNQFDGGNPWQSKSGFGDSTGGGSNPWQQKNTAGWNSQKGFGGGNSPWQSKNSGNDWQAKNNFAGAW